MDNQSAETIARKTLRELDRRRTPFSLLLLSLIVLVLVGFCLGLSWIKQFLERRDGGESPEGCKDTLRLIQAPAQSATPASFILMQTGMAGRDDLFLYTTVPTITHRNLTESPAITEMWPVLDVITQRVAYYGVGEAGTDLYIQSLPDGMALPLTVHAGESGLHTDFEITPTIAPVFAPNSRWLAFPAQAKKHGAIELFIAQDDGQRVLRVTDLGYQVRDYIWLDDHTLVIAVQWSDGTSHHWIARLGPQGEPRLEPLP